MATTIRGSDNFDTAPEGLGKVVGYHRHAHTGSVYMDSSTLVQIGQQVSYTPKFNNSILIAKHTIVARSGGSNAECRVKFAFNINGGSTGIVGPVGTYDYDNSGGIWNLNNYVFTTNHQVTNNAYPWTWDLFGATQNDNQGNGGFYFNESANENAGFISQTEIWEIAQ